MFRSNRLLVVASLIGLVLVSIGLGVMLVSLDAKENRYQSYRYAADKPEDVDPASPRKPDAKPFQYRTPCEEPKGKDESDLCAQWRAAEAAEDSALWAKWGFWISTLGSGLLLWQIILTREALADTGLATKAMERQNKIAIATQRAWIDVQFIVEDYKIIGDHLVIEWNFTYRNIGQSLAKSFYYFFRADFRETTVLKTVVEWNSDWMKPPAVPVEDSGGLMPGESRVYRGNSFIAIKNINWSNRGWGDSFKYTARATAYYFLNGEEELPVTRQTSRTFEVGFKDQALKNYIFKDSFANKSVDDVIVTVHTFFAVSN